MEEEQELSMVGADLYFLIYKFLSGGPLQETLKTFHRELEQCKILPQRLDWLGDKHERTIEDLKNQFPNVRPDYLLQLCCKAGIASTSTETGSDNKVVTLFNLRKKSSNGVDYNFKQLWDYVRRFHLVPPRDCNATCNIANVIRGREISGPFSRRWLVSPKLYNALQFQRRTLGHLSAVYCLLFDHSGNYILTGADDLLIKLWSAHTGCLMNSFRGASSEITDIAVNLENTLLAAGSIDRMLRIWDLQTGAPVAVLAGHTGMITSVNFCPSPSWNLHHLVSTSGDGSVGFWAYRYDTAGKVDFSLKPTMYQEKMRPGQAQMICSSFSPGGVFLACGSADHHVRVYYMKGDEGPHRILETEAHNDRVDSIQWAHQGLRFLSGSKDGVAIVWSFECQQWKNLYLHMTTKLTNSKKAAEDSKKLKVTMVAWNQSDTWAITAVSDYTLKIWDARTGQLFKVLTGHADEIYVLESHPHDRHVILSAGHDGLLFVWDIIKGEVMSRFANTIENQGQGAVFDAKWSPDGNSIAASDSHGNLLIFGFGKGNPLFEQLPKELFFHTDYRPLVRDANNYVLDEQTQIEPHLMPPPFLVDIDGNPYPPMLQRLVPGREHCKTEQLIPSIVIGNEGNQEVVQMVVDENPRSENERNQDPHLEDLRGSAHISRPGNRRIRDAEGIRLSTGEWQRDPNMKWKKYILVQPMNKNQIKKVREYVEEMERFEKDEYNRQLSKRPHMITTTTINESASKLAAEKKKNTRRFGKGKKAAPVNTPPVMMMSSDTEMESQHYSSSGYSDWEADEEVRRHSKRTRKKPPIHDYNSDEEEESDENDYVRLKIDDDEDTNDEESNDEESNEEDDDEEEAKERRNSDEKKKTGRDNGNGKKKTSPGQARSAAANAAAASAGSSGVNAARASTAPVENQQQQAPPREAATRMNHVNKDAVPEIYKTSEWLTEVRPRKSPYFPQMGDEVVYFIQGHNLYLEAVRAKKIYEINSKSLPWTKIHLRSYEYCKVVGIQYEIKPPRLCNLKLALLDEEGRLTGKMFTVKYHDMPDVLDFFVLKQNFQVAMSRDWQVDDKFRCIIDDSWWVGEIVSISTTSSDSDAVSPFLCYEIKWDNGELERMSPWDMEPLDEERIPENVGEALPVLENELENMMYQPNSYDWPNNDRVTATRHILAGLSKVMELAIAEPFLVPVDLNVYPTYAMIIEYPVDLSTIKARFENYFYRRVMAAQFDIKHLATNAEKFNERHSVIVKRARILTELCLRIVKQCTTDLDVTAIYHQLVDTYDSEEDPEIDVENVQPVAGAPGASSSTTTNRMLRSLPNRYLRHAKNWKKEARLLLEAIWDCEDSMPFRMPVDHQKYPDYTQVISRPMDLSTVKDKLLNNSYESPTDFYNDMKLIFVNSRKYNTDVRSRIFAMTVRLAAIFEDHMTKIIRNWKVAKRRINNGNNLGQSRSSSSTTTTAALASANNNTALTARVGGAESSSATNNNRKRGSAMTSESSSSSTSSSGSCKGSRKSSTSSPSNTLECSNGSSSRKRRERDRTAAAASSSSALVGSSASTNAVQVLENMNSNYSSTASSSKQSASNVNSNSHFSIIINEKEYGRGNKSTQSNDSSDEDNQPLGRLQVSKVVKPPITAEYERSRSSSSAATSNEEAEKKEEKEEEDSFNTTTKRRKSKKTKPESDDNYSDDANYKPTSSLAARKRNRQFDSSTTTATSSDDSSDVTTPASSDSDYYDDSLSRNNNNNSDFDDESSRPSVTRGRSTRTTAAMAGGGKKSNKKTSAAKKIKLGNNVNGKIVTGSLSRSNRRTTIKKKRRSRSSDDNTSSDDNDFNSNSDDDDDDEDFSLGGSSEKRKNKRVNNNNNNNNNGGRSSDASSSFFTSVSSRGRVRKLNPRVRALIKN